MNLISNFNPKGKKILAITAHPDDADFCCGGTFLKWISQGASGAIVIVTNGDKGSHNNRLTGKQLANIRYKEQLAASKFIGLDYTWFLQYPDAHLEVSQELKAKIVKIIRSYQPDVVFTWDPKMIYSTKKNIVNHPDHIAVGQAALNAVFPLARDPLTYKEFEKDGLKPHCVSDIFLFNFDQPNYYEDISDYLKKKLELLKYHRSQVKPKEMEKTVRDWCISNGKEIDAKYAECFVHISFDRD